MRVDDDLETDENPFAELLSICERRDVDALRAFCAEGERETVRRAADAVLDGRITLEMVEDEILGAVVVEVSRCRTEGAH